MVKQVTDKKLDELNSVATMAAKTLTELLMATNSLEVVVNPSTVDTTDDTEIAIAVWTNIIASVEGLLDQVGAFERNDSLERLARTLY